MDVIVVGKARRRSPRSSRPGMPATPEAVPDARRRFLDALKPLAGAYVPGAYEVSYAVDGRIAAVKPLEPGVPPVVAKRRLRDVNAFETRSIIKTPRPSTAHAAPRGRQGLRRGCRFCLEARCTARGATGVSSRSARPWRKIAKESKRVAGGACVSDYPWIGELN